MNPSQIKRGSGVSLWRQIEDQIADDIASGVIAPGSRLPTEHDLAGRFHVNRHTIRRAMKALEDNGLIRIEQGRGTFVQEHVIDYPVRRRTSFADNLIAQKRQPGGWILRTENVAASSDVADSLKIDKGAPVTLIRAIGEADGRPVSLANHYFSTDQFPDIAEAFEETRSAAKALAKFGVSDFLRKITRVTARMPDKEEAHVLNQPANRPVVVAESINVDSNGEPVEYRIACFAGDRVQLVFEP